MALTPAQVTPALLIWARTRAGLSEDALADKLRLHVDKILSWEAGTGKPTFKQAQKLAKAVDAPFGFLFLTKPPEEDLPIPDLRTVKSAPLKKPSTALRDLLREITGKHEWFVDHLKDIGAAQSLDFVGKFDTTNTDAVVDDLNKRIKYDRKTKDADAYLRSMVDAAEASGILVLRSGVVGNNTHRPLDVNEFRGFAIADPLAPLIFINGNDAVAGRIFTLAHELAHIWIGQTGVSGGELTPHRAVERFCNGVAGEFLVPAAHLREEWNSTRSWNANLGELAKTFCVSRVVIARRAADLNIVGREIYDQVYSSALSEFKASEGGGGDFYRTAKSRNSPRLARAVVQEALSGRMLLREAGALLNVQPSKIHRFAQELTE